MRLIPGILLTCLLSAVAFFASTLPFFKAYHVSPLVLCIVFGMVVGNLFSKLIPKQCQVGIKFSQQKILRLGIVLYGFFITFQQIISVGVPGFVTDIIIIATTFMGGSYIGMKVLKMEKELAMLTSVGASICGAAAVLGAEPVLKAKPHQTAVAVATVVIFGTISMFLYPFIYQSFSIPEAVMGIYTGATVHEVAQVVAAGNVMSQQIGIDSVIVKLTRVMMLAPFLLLLSIYLSKQSKTAGSLAEVHVPWFAVLFVVAAGINSLAMIPSELVTVLTQASIICLTVAMGALGLETNIAKIRDVGLQPLLLAALIFLWLLLGGFVITYTVYYFFT